MDTREYRDSLVARISDGERVQLESPDGGLFINEHNRTALLEMLEEADGSGNVALQDVDIERAERLERELQEYLDEYMSENPEAHKWIVLASLYLTFVARRPMHPMERAGIVASARGSKTLYHCPAKVEDSFICRSCVCEPSQEPYWMVDIFPKQVPSDRGSVYFAVERYLLDSPHKTDVYEKLARVLLKVNCYYDLLVEEADSGWTLNPDPQTLVERVRACGLQHGSVSLNVAVEPGDALFVLAGDDLSMTLFNPSEDLLELVSAVASAEGLFVWGPQLFERC